MIDLATPGWVNGGHTRWHRIWSCAGPAPQAVLWRVAAEARIEACRQCTGEADGHLEMVMARHSLGLLNPPVDEAPGYGSWIEWGTRGRPRAQMGAA